MRPQMALSRALEKKLPWQASWPTRNSRTIANVTTSMPSSFSSRLSASRTIAVPALKNAMSSSSTMAGSRSWVLDVSKEHSRALRFQVLA